MKLPECNVRYGYFEVATNQGTGYICVALKRPDRGNTRHEAAFSYCSPKEKVFSKKLARSIASARLDRGKKVVFEHDGGIKGAFVKALGATHDPNLRSTPNMIPPGWVKKNMSRWHMTFGLRGSTTRPRVCWKRDNLQVGYLRVGEKTIVV